MPTPMEIEKLDLRKGFGKPISLVVPRSGFEPLTCPLGGGRAIQLCHRGMVRSIPRQSGSFDHQKRLIAHPNPLNFGIRMIYPYYCQIITLASSAKT